MKAASFSTSKMNFAELVISVTCTCKLLRPNMRAVHLESSESKKLGVRRYSQCETKKCFSNHMQERSCVIKAIATSACSSLASGGILRHDAIMPLLVECLSVWAAKLQIYYSPYLIN